MNDSELKTIEDLAEFLRGTRKNHFKVPHIGERYPWIERTLKRFQYLGLSKKEKGIVLSYIRKCTGYSRQQLSRLVAKYRYHGTIQPEKPNRYRFPRKYTPEDLALLVGTDNLHGRLSGPTTKKILERAYQQFSQREYRRLSQISVSHLYNLRQEKRYRHQALYLQKTRPTSREIGERCIPQPQGKPGYLRVDTVHQGDQNGRKGVYHINTVDEVTQFQVVACVPLISESYVLPILEDILAQYPFPIREFHVDNGSEYINHQVQALLQRLLIKLTKSRARHPNDNALVESKNGSILRKYLGYAHIPATHAQAIHTFYRQWFNPYLNFHRPCLFAEITFNSRGKQIKTYPYDNIMTPYEKLRRLPHAVQCLKKGVSFRQLDAFAHQNSDNDFAQQMNRAKDKLFRL
jgi:transposase InsO family protein